MCAWSINGELNLNCTNVLVFRKELRSHFLSWHQIVTCPLGELVKIGGTEGAVSYLVPSKMELVAVSRYTSQVNSIVFPHMTVVLLAIGMFFTAWFFIYEITSTKYTQAIYKEQLNFLVASLFMGFGVPFLLLWVSIYV